MTLDQRPDGVKVGTAAVVPACVRGDADATRKINGILIVRSVRQSCTFLRTHGSFGYGHQGHALKIEKCVERYRRILDATYRPDIGLLLERFAPTGVIIVDCDEVELIRISCVLHDDCQQVQLDE